ncbi:MAG: DUF3135 domain-containing protein [Rhodocyclaceae bacterium]
MNKHRQPKELPSFEELSRLARDDPQALEVLRGELINECIGKAPEHLRVALRRLQFRIDGVRRRSRTSLAAAVKLNALMWSEFLEMNDALQDLVRGAHGRSRLPDADKRRTSHCARSARIIEFRPRPAAGLGSMSTG